MSDAFKIYRIHNFLNLVDEIFMPGFKMVSNNQKWYPRKYKIKIGKLREASFGYWNKLKPTKLILKRCSCVLINMPSKKRVIESKEYLNLWRVG